MIRNQYCGKVRLKKCNILSYVGERNCGIVRFGTISRKNVSVLNGFRNFCFCIYLRKTRIHHSIRFFSNLINLRDSRNVILSQVSHFSFDSLKNEQLDEANEDQKIIGLWQFCNSDKNSVNNNDKNNDTINDKNNDTINDNINDMINYTITDKINNKINDGNKIFVKHNFHEVINFLSKKKDARSITANILFFIFNSLDIKNIKTGEEYKRNITKLYGSLIRCYHKIFKNGNNGEYIFSLFNDELLKVVSPSLKRNKKGIVYDVLLNSLDFYFKNNIEDKKKLNINILCEIITYKKLFYVMNSINYDMTSFKEKLNVLNLNYLLSNFLRDSQYMKDVIQLSSIYYSEDTHICTPFKEGCLFNCFFVLNKILQNQSKNFLFLFLNSIKYDDLKMEVLTTLLSTDRVSGCFSNYWGYLTTKEYMLLEDSKSEEKIYQQLEKVPCMNAIQLMKIDENNKKKGSEKNKDKEFYTLPKHIKHHIIIVSSLDEIKKMINQIKKEQEEHWQLHIYNNEEIYNIKGCKHIINENHIYKNLKKKKKLFYVGLDSEWDRYQKLRIISVATSTYIYIIDLLNMNYKSTNLLCFFFLWLLENPFICKLFYSFTSDIQRISFHFEKIKNIVHFSNVIDLRDPIIIEENQTEEDKTKEDKTKEDKTEEDKTEENNIKTNKTNKRKENFDVLLIEKWNREILESGNVSFFKTMSEDTLYCINKKIKHDSKEVENILIGHNKTKKIYFKSLNDLCKNILKKELYKEMQNSTWNKRPLTKEQIYYVSIDAYVLIELENQLLQNNCFSTCLTNSNQLNTSFLQKYKTKDCKWKEDILLESSWEDV